MTEAKTKSAATKVAKSKKSVSDDAIKPKKAKAASVAADKQGGATKSKVAAEKKTTAKQSTAESNVTKVTKSSSVRKSPAPETNNDAATAAARRTKPARNINPEERYRMVQTAAYYIAERHGFLGRLDEHWAEAEREIAAILDK
ncbi:MAG: DUF2934 domain-containing protein [Gallionella sp.]